MKKVLVLLSGGMDSTVLLHHHVKAQRHEVRALAVDYGQRHSVELDCAAWQAASLGVPFQIADLSCLAELLPGSSQTDSSVAVPEGHYSAENMKATVVPNRNMILLSVALGHAIAHKMEAVSYAAHSGDHAIYPDCRKEFVEAMAQAAALCDWNPAMIISPFVGISKADIARMGVNLEVDFRQTWSCYKGGSLHCGRCGTCIERREAFHLARKVDPTEYAVGAPSVAAMVKAEWKI